MSDAASISEQLDGKRQGKGYLARCPAHDDKKASLSIADGENGKILLYCHAGCDFKAIAAKLGLNGQAENGRQFVCAYPYHDLNGQIAHETVRYRLPDGDKAFTQRRPNGKGGYIYKDALQGIPLYPYRVRELRAGIEAHQAVYITEGEKDADTLASLGMVATTNPMGANKPKVWAEIAKHFTGADVVIVPDNDPPGQKNIDVVGVALKPYAKSISGAKVAAPHKDITEWVLTDGPTTGAELMLTITDWTPATAIKELPAGNPLGPVEPAAHAERFALSKTRDVLTRPKPIWLYPGEIPSNSLVTLTGQSGNGKTFIAIDYALTIARTYKVIYVATERPYAALMRGNAWLDHHHGDDTNMAWIEQAPTLTDAADVQALTAAIKTFGAAFVVIDTFSRCADGIDEDSNSQVKRVMQALDNLRRDTGATIMVVHHTGWSGGRERGASAMRDYAEVAILVEKDADGAIKVSCNKMSAADEFEPRYMRIIAHDDQALVIPAENVLQTGDKLTKNQLLALETLALETYADTGARKSELIKEAHIPEGSAGRVLSALKRFGYLRQAQGGDPYFITVKGKSKLSEVSRYYHDTTDTPAQSSSVGVSFGITPLWGDTSDTSDMSANSVKSKFNIYGGRGM